MRDGYASGLKEKNNKKKLKFITMKPSLKKIGMRIILIEVEERQAHL